MVTKTEPPSDRSVHALRQFARQQRDRLHRHRWGLADAILMCAEEIADDDVHKERVELERRMRAFLDCGEPVPPGLWHRWKELLDYPYEFRDERVIAFRAPVKIRLAKTLAEVTSRPSPFMIAKVTEPLLELSKARTFARQTGLGHNRRQAKSRAFAEARGTVRRRLRAKSADRFWVFASEQEATAILENWASRNGYPSLKIEPEFFFPSPSGRTPSPNSSGND